MIVSAGALPLLQVEHLPLELRARAARQAVLGHARPEAEREEEHGEPLPHAEDAFPLPSFKEHRRTLVAAGDKAYLARLMEQSGGSIKNACAMAKLSRTRLYILLKQHGMTK
jgi:two-component system NtrC family response regulator